LGVRVRLPLCRGGVQLVVVRSGSFGLSRLLLDLAGFPVILEVFRPPSSGGCPPSGPLRLCLPFSALVSCGLVEPAILSWDSPAPPSTSLRASTPGGDPKIVSIGPRLPHRKSCSALVVSHHLDGLLRSELAGLLHPAIDPGVRRVSGHRLPHTAEAIRGLLGPSPRRTHPGELLLADSRTASPRPLPPCRFLSRSQRLLRGCARNLDVPDWRARTRSEVDVAAASGDRQGRSTSRLSSVDESVTSSAPLLVPGRPVLHGLSVPSKVPLAARTRWNALV
jgi:hypothetical protein